MRGVGSLQPRPPPPLPRKPQYSNTLVGLRTALRDTHHRRPQQAIVDDITGLQHLNNCATGFVGPLGLKDRLMEIVVETFALRIDALNTVPLEYAEELPLRRRDAREEIARPFVPDLALR